MLTYTIFNTGKPLVYTVNNGKAATIEIGKVSIGDVPNVENVGTSSHAILDFTLPAGGGGGTSVNVDSYLSDTSVNPVQNRVITQAINDKANKVHFHKKTDIIDFPTSLPASDVYSWAKSQNKPTYNSNEISGLSNVARTGSYNDLLDKPDIGSVVSDTELSITSTNPVQNKVITQKINLLDSDVLEIESSISRIERNLSTVATSGKYSDLIGLPTLSAVASTGKYSDLIEKPEKAASIAPGEQGYVSGEMVYNYSTAMTLSTKEEVQAIIDEATASYSESLLNQQLDEINGEIV